MKTAVAALALSVALLPVLPASAQPEPLGFVRREVQKRGPETFRWGEVAGGRDALRRLWERYDQEGAPPAIRFRRKVAVVAGTGQSSTCPTKLHDLRLHRDRKRVVFRVYAEDPGEGGGCTDDWGPKTFTVAVARADLRPLRPLELRVRVRRIEDPDG